MKTFSIVEEFVLNAARVRFISVLKSLFVVYQMQLSVFSIVALCLTALTSYASATNRPIIGVLAQEMPRHYARKFHLVNNASTYIPASYVKQVEASGARIVPIFIKQSLQYYR